MRTLPQCKDLCGWVAGPEATRWQLRLGWSAPISGAFLNIVGPRSLRSSLQITGTFTRSCGQSPGRLTHLPTMNMQQCNHNCIAEPDSCRQFCFLPHLSKRVATHPKWRREPAPEI